MIKTEFGEVKLEVSKITGNDTSFQEAELFADMVCIITALDEALGTDATIRIIENALKITYGEREDIK